ncbi:serine/threonine-protein kinase [Paractinoplanes rishiriensis]|uniref:non-specific serine/threonine protein kinase n=1 Tax=Paractinoplanes rishiriensis TaxID=1050105 RepID=A0A919K9M2_9ACTN|nr:serine/threonine-protein kinase [Actinoplanes rishiriensis]GIF01381.1 hypothetical protein Ari01nite_88450 [Actinoplanes rishiriensis]
MLAPGQLLNDRYRLDERIAAGGMGEVWRGTDVLLHRGVAVKVLLPKLMADAEFITRFRTEARMMAALRHPGIVQVYDYAESAPDYLVMEYVDGIPLSTMVRAAGGLGVPETLTIVAQAADALQVAHEAGIVHRDVKPSNLLIRPGGGVVLVDFGVARSVDITGITSPNVVMGSVHYMAPEQAEGQPVTPVSDVYALGTVAYFCLVGRPPYVGENPVYVLNQLVNGDPPELPDDLPLAAAELLLRTLDKDPAQRYPTAAALAEAARAVLETLPTGSFGISSTDAPSSFSLSSSTNSSSSAATPSSSDTSSASSSAIPSSSATPYSAAPSSSATPSSPAVPSSAARSSTTPPPTAGRGKRRVRTALALVAAAVVIAAGGVAVGLAVRPGLGEAQNPGDGDSGLAAGPSASRVPSAGAPAVPGAVPSSSRPGNPGRTPVVGPSRAASSAPVAGVPAPTAAPTGVTPAPTGGGAGNPYTPGEVCGNKFAVVDSAPLLAGDGTLQGRVYLLYNATSGRNCTTTLKAADVGTATATSAYLEAEGADRVADSGQFEYYAGPVKVKSAETCVKWGGAAGGVRFDSPSGHCP